MQVWYTLSLQKMTIIDVGCGTGSNSKYMCSQQRNIADISDTCTHIFDLDEVLCEMNLFWKCLYSFSSKHVIVHYVQIKYPAMTYFDVLLYFDVANTNISRHEDYDHIPERRWVI